MKKTTYLMILILITVHFFDILPLGYVMDMSGGIVGTLLLYVWMFVGFRYFRSRSDHHLFTSANKKPIIWVLFGIFLSFIPAYIFYGQSFLTSFFAYRNIYIWFSGLLILYISPKPNELIKVLSYFFVLFTIASLLKTIFKQSMFYYPTNIAGDWALENSDSEISFVDGLSLLLIPLYYYTGQVRENVTKKAMRYMMAIFFVLLMIQNRSTLFIAVIVVLLMMVTKKTKYRVIFLCVFGVLALFFFAYTSDIWMSLFNETTTQLDDEEYNRVKAFAYFMNEANKSWITAVFGNGFLSAHSTLQMYDLLVAGIVNSDMGFIGFWNQFGIIPIIVFIYCIVKSIINKAIPLYVKATGFHILCGALTMSYLAMGSPVLMFVFYYSLYVHYLQNGVNDNKCDRNESIIPNPTLS